MYHEMIMALLGDTGNIFEYDGRFFKVSKHLQVPLFHPSELVVVDEILEVASLYKRLQAFLEAQLPLELQSAFELESTIGVNKAKLVGFYVTSVCNGIEEILREYQEAISDLEMEILEEPYITISDIRIKVGPFQSVFQALDSMIMKIQGQSRSSALIVETVKSEYDLNVHLQDKLIKLIPWVNRILYNQIINWVLFGSLHDTRGEFFIKQKCPDETDAISKSSHGKHVVAKMQNHEKYFVDYAIVPAHFPLPLTERILYIGASVGILSNSEKTKSSIVIKQKHFHEKLKQLPIETFRVELLSEAIEEIAAEVGKDLHHLVVAETDLPKHMGIIKDFYLTGRGELFHDFLLNLKTIPMAKNSLLADVRQAFTLAATRVQVQDEILQRISINLPTDLGKPKLDLIMSTISLHVEDEWPLHILFSQECLSKYNELFRFLLQIRFLQIELNTIWLNTRHIFRFPVPRGPAELRNVMSYFINHLQHYLQEDVLENQYAILVNAIEKSENFDQILVAHAQFQSNISAQSFRNSKQLRHFLDEIIKVCINYVDFINNHLQVCEAKDLPINEGISKEVTSFFIDFRRHMDLLLSLLKNMALNPQSGQYLGQFLLRLDFNSYFSSIISGFNV